MSLKLIQRGRIWYIRGTVRGRPCFETTGTSERGLAEALRAKREAELFEASVFGDRAVVTFRRAALSYLDFEPRSDRTKDYVGALVAHFADTRLALIDQTAADRAVERIVGVSAAPATKTRVVYTPLTAVLTHAAKRQWCGHPHFDKPKPPKGKTRWLTPAEAAALIAGAAPHLKPLLTFMLCTGARVSEAIELQWADVDLAVGMAILRETKNGSDRAARLTPGAVLTLANLPGEEVAPGEWVKRGAVFRRDDGEPYANRERYEGGQIKTAWATACRRAGLVRPALDQSGAPKMLDGESVLETTATPHDLRHSWATWFYALTKDFMLLKDEGGWRTLSMVERYAHLMPSELVPDIAKIWGASHPRIGLLPNLTKSVQPAPSAAEKA